MATGDDKTWLSVGQKIVRVCSKVFEHSFLPELLLPVIFILARYLLNADFSYPSEIWLPVGLFGVLALLVFVGYKATLPSTRAAHMAGVPLICVLYNFGGVFGYTQSLLPKQWSNLAVSLVAVLVAGAVCGVFGFLFDLALRKSAWLERLQLYKIMLFALAFVFVVETVQVGYRVITIYDQLTYTYTAPKIQRSGAAVSKPDVYYLVFDRYASNDTLKNTYNYDNSNLTNFLASSGFVTRREAYANYPFTMQSISSTLAMNYFPDLQKKFGNVGFQTAFPYRSIFNNPPIAQILKQNGYKYNQVSSWWDFSRVGIQADTNLTESFDLQVAGQHVFVSDLDRDIINGSVLSPLLKAGWPGVLQYVQDNNPRQNFEQQMSALQQIASRPDKAVPQFTFAHILSPHDPYIFDAAGQTPTYDANRTDNGADELVKYTNQVTYLNTRIQQIISEIRSQSPGAAIVIQADEGPYPKEFRYQLTPSHYYNPISLPLPQMKQKFGILASYFMPGVDAQTVSQNIVASVDPFRFILQHYLGYDTPPLPDCQFATGDKYMIYSYQQVTGQLRGTNNPDECRAYE